MANFNRSLQNFGKNVNLGNFQINYRMNSEIRVFVTTYPKNISILFHTVFLVKSYWKFSECGNYNRFWDVVFVLDESGSISTQEYTDQQTFFSAIASAVHISDTSARFAAVTVHNTATQQFAFTDYTTAAQISTALSSLPAPSGNSDFGEGLLMAYNIIHTTKRAGSTGIIIGASDDGSGDTRANTPIVVADSNTNGYKILVIGMGVSIAAAATDPSYFFTSLSSDDILNALCPYSTYCIQFPTRGSTQVLLCRFLVCCGYDISYIVSVHIQCQASIYSLSLCRGHSWRLRLAKQETLTPPGHLVSPLVCRDPWMSTVVLYCWCHSDSASVLLYFTLFLNCSWTFETKTKQNKW